MKKSEANIEDLKGKVVSDGTMRPEDLIPKFLNVLKVYGKDVYDKYVGENPEVLDLSGMDDETLGWVVDELFDKLNEIAPEGYSFGSQDGDGACYGFWSEDADERKKCEVASEIKVGDFVEYDKDGKEDWNWAEVTGVNEDGTLNLHITDMDKTNYDDVDNVPAASCHKLPRFAGMTDTGHYYMDGPINLYKGGWEICVTKKDLDPSKYEFIGTIDSYEDMPQVDAYYDDNYVYDEDDESEVREYFGVDFPEGAVTFADFKEDVVGESCVKGMVSEGWSGGFFSREDVLNAMDGGILNKDWKLEKRFGNWGCSVNQKTGRPLVMQVMVSQDRTGDWGYKPVTSDMGPVDTNIQAAKWLKPRLEQWASEDTKNAESIPDYEWHWIDKCLGKETANKDRKNLVKSLVKGDKIKLIDTVANGAVVTFIDMITPSKMRIDYNGREMSCKTSFIDHKVEGATESKKCEAYIQPVTLYSTTRYDDAEAVQSFLRDIGGDAVTVDKQRNGDVLSVNVSGSDEDVEAFVDTYKNEYGSIVKDCEVDATGWTAPEDIVEPDAEMVAALHKKADDDKKWFGEIAKSFALELEEVGLGGFVPVFRPKEPYSIDDRYAYNVEWQPYDKNGDYVKNDAFKSKTYGFVDCDRLSDGRIVVNDYRPLDEDSIEDFVNVVVSGGTGDEGIFLWVLDKYKECMDKTESKKSESEEDDTEVVSVDANTGYVNVYGVNLTYIDRDGYESSVDDMQYAKIYYDEDEAIRDAKEAADSYKDDDRFVHVFVTAGEQEKPNGDIVGQPYDIFVASSKDKATTAKYRELASYANADIEYDYYAGETTESLDPSIDVKGRGVVELSEDDYLKLSRDINSRGYCKDKDGAYNVWIGSSFKGTFPSVEAAADAGFTLVEGKRCESKKSEVVSDTDSDDMKVGKFAATLLADDNEYVCSVPGYYDDEVSAENAAKDYLKKNGSVIKSVCTVPTKISIWTVVKDDYGSNLPKDVKVVNITADESKKSESLTDKEEHEWYRFWFDEVKKRVVPGKSGSVEHNCKMLPYSDVRQMWGVAAQAQELCDNFRRYLTYRGYTNSKGSPFAEISWRAEDAAELLAALNRADGKPVETCFTDAPKKSESLTLKQKELKDMARFGQAEDITTISDAEAKELKKKGIETVGISRGVYGMNGALLRDSEGKKYVITARSSNLFYFV